jgi:hypothetical protein
METNFQPNVEQSSSAQPQPAAPVQNVTNEPKQPKGGKKIHTGLAIGIVVLVAVIILVAVILMAMNFLPSPIQTPVSSATPSPSVQVQQLPTSEDSTASIGQQIDDTTINDVDSQFKDIDADLNQL